MCISQTFDNIKLYTEVNSFIPTGMVTTPIGQPSACKGINNFELRSVNTHRAGWLASYDRLSDVRSRS